MNFVIREIQPEDAGQVKKIIKTVMPEFGAGGEGFAIHDKEVENMYEAYHKPRAIYFVVEIDGKVVGGGGIAQLDGGTADICELKKMYFLPEAREKGLGKLVLEKCLAAAKRFEYKQCYLETFNTMHGAMKLYEHMGFKKIAGPLGNTGHFSCDKYYLKQV
ncbi:MAG TPA: GNAT family N-acetyltransferase [Cyclobacteriaceae bacterium]|nr:GNAT family N-acetyltransferase [Cyclobacteriaceae bacterium]